MDNEAAAVIQGIYHDYKRVPSQKVLRLLIDVPIEMEKQVHDTMLPGSIDGACWVAVAVLNPEHARLKQAFKDSVEVEKKGGRLAKQCAMTCQEQTFRQFLIENHGFGAGDVADFIYEWCGIDSRRELDHNEAAASNWRDLESEYQAWMQV